MKKASELRTPEDYVEALILGAGSLNTLRNYHIAAYKQGLLNEEEEATATSMTWEMARIIKLYQVQLEFLVERYQLDEKKILERLRDE